MPYSDATVWFPWNVNDIESVAAFNLQQTLLLSIPLVFTGLAVAFAFRCGMFNISGQGQYIVGAMVSVWVGSSWVDMNSGCTSCSRSAWPHWPALSGPGSQDS